MGGYRVVPPGPDEPQLSHPLIYLSVSFLLAILEQLGERTILTRYTLPDQTFRHGSDSVSTSGE